MKKIAKSPKLIIAVIVSLLFSTSIANAQNRRHQPPPPRLPDSCQINKMVGELAKELTLTESQKAKISDLYFTHFNEAKVMMKKHREAQEKNMEAMEEYRKNLETQVTDVLTKEQKAEYKEYMKCCRPPGERLQNRGRNGHRKGRHGNGRR
jgi:Spy/CpxP family protein refolding chaperone